VVTSRTWCCGAMWPSATEAAGRAATAVGISCGTVRERGRQLAVLYSGACPPGRQVRYHQRVVNPKTMKVCVGSADDCRACGRNRLALRATMADRTNSLRDFDATFRGQTIAGAEPSPETLERSWPMSDNRFFCRIPFGCRPASWWRAGVRPDARRFASTPIQPGPRV